MRKRIARRILLIAGVVISILSLVFGFTSNFNTLVICAFCASVLMIIYGLSLGSKRVLIGVTVSLAVLLVLFAGFNVFLYRFGQNDTVTYKEDALIVLGAGIADETPSLILQARLEAVLEYYLRNPEVVIVVSGGQGPRESVTEALAMERYLVSGGVPSEKILKEEEATTTRENIAFSKGLLDEYFDGEYTIAFITNDFHVFRTHIIVLRVGLTGTHMHAKIPRYSIPANYLRESIACLFEVILPY